ncbi:TRAPP I, II and III complex Rab GEF subunit Bet5 [Schizosaccharomyces osmophilus]|uniref:Trafficking protein particle complex subunit n=1 Tax=Schizosaccharomyces osmophilus TaxID=2545709 RepID=A0AAE9WA56_9SCHI|nr:TRAPP I, II and III complex Rab GEF subunit Bet5 [Schizosaccharomyces osmophilus]WBW72178.1 TRAPP I, II and III complex Rab GEF subunit Bet5 [Schizosaccharomyces osmophilus]
MAVYAFYIFSRKNECVFAHRWKPADSNSMETLVSQLESTAFEDDVEKLMFGVTFSLRNLVRKVSNGADEFLSYSTNQYKLHFYETPTNLRLVLFTSPKVEPLTHVLHQIYATLYIEFVVKHPLYTQVPPPLEKGGINCEMFRITLDRFVRTLRYVMLY